MFKRGWTRRNGLPTSDEATFDERMFRDGQILTDVTAITDPEYLSEPLVKSTEYLKADNANFATYPCREVTEIPRHEGDIPMHLPNQTAVEQDYPGAHWCAAEGLPGRGGDDVPGVSGEHRRSCRLTRRSSRSSSRRNSRTMPMRTCEAARH